MENHIPSALLTELKSEHVILFVGSGLSVNAGLPTWAELLVALRELLDSDDESAAFFDGLDPTQQAQYLYDQVGKAVVVDRIVDLFRRSAIAPTAAHRAIVSLPVKTIITTNWDNLLEWQFQEDRVTCDVIWDAEQIGATTHRRKVVKVHGTLGEARSIVFSEDEYCRFANSNDIFKQYLRTLLATSTVLFVGYSYRDFDFKLIFQNIREQLGSLAWKSYIFTPNAGEPERQYFTRRGLIPIHYSAGSRREAVESFFSDLVARASVIVKSTDDRLRILGRENRAMLPKARGLVIRNQSNLGPLATPEVLADMDLFGSPETTRLELECAANWRALIERGATARCILCLNNYLARGKYDPREAGLRLQTLRANLQKYLASVEVVDIGVPLDNNVEIYGGDVLLRSEKLDMETKSYNQLRVIRDIDEVRQAIETFDSRYRAVRSRNLARASALFGLEPVAGDAAAERDLLHRYILRLIGDCLASL